MTSLIPLIVSPALPAGWHLWFTVNCLHNIGWIAMTSGTDVYIPLRMNCNNFGDPPDFPSRASIVLPITGLWANASSAHSSTLCSFTSKKLWLSVVQISSMKHSPQRFVILGMQKHNKLSFSAIDFTIRWPKKIIWICLHCFLVTRFCQLPSPEVNKEKQRTGKRWNMATIGIGIVKIWCKHYPTKRLHVDVVIVPFVLHQWRCFSISLMLFPIFTFTDVVNWHF